MRIINNPDFSKELKRNIKNIIDNPYMCPPSNYFNDKDVRGMTYKKYTIIYQVSLNRNKPPTLSVR